VIDLSQLCTVGPMFAVRLAATLDLHAESGSDSQVLAPLRPDVASSLSQLRASAKTPSENVLLPCTRLRSVEFVELVGERLADKLHPAFDTDRLASTLMLCFSELCANALAPDTIGSAYVAADREKSRLRLAVGDLGSGIPAAQRQRNPSLVDERDALWAAFRSPANPSRAPLHGCCGILRQLRSLDGTATLRVWSGTARLTLALRGGRLLTRRSTLAPRTPGTWVLVDISRPDMHRSDGSFL